jgi:myo-inositol-1(or 4)-monophosphatase
VAEERIEMDPSSSPPAEEVRDVLELAIRLSREAGAIQRAGYESEHEISTKSASIDLVTEVDQACEERIVQSIATARPGDAILAEEGGASDHQSADWCWVVDPLDGTINYAHGLPRFCVSIGVEYRGQRSVGVVYDPLLDELYEATRGGGARLGGRTLRVSTECHLDRAMLATGFAYDVHTSDDDNLANFGRMLKQVRALRRDGSAALDLCYVAAGRLDAYWEMKLHPWDVAAGLLIVEEAGGHCTDWSGNAAPSSGVELVVSNGQIHESILALLEH